MLSIPKGHFAVIKPGEFDQATQKFPCLKDEPIENLKFCLSLGDCFYIYRMNLDGTLVACKGNSNSSAKEVEWREPLELTMSNYIVIKPGELDAARKRCKPLDKYCKCHGDYIITYSKDNLVYVWGEVSNGSIGWARKNEKDYLDKAHPNRVELKWSSAEPEAVTDKPKQAAPRKGKELSSTQYIAIEPGKMQKARETFPVLDEFCKKEESWCMLLKSPSTCVHFFISANLEEHWVSDESWLNTNYPSRVKLDWDTAESTKVDEVKQASVSFYNATPVSTEENMNLTQKEIQQIAEAAAAIASSNPAAKKGVASRATSAVWRATKGAVAYTFAPWKVWANHAVFLAAVSSIGYGVFKTVEAVRKIPMPVITFDETSPSDKS